jgi:hypothetical protein
MRDGFVFYRSFYEAINELPDENFKKVVCAICRYALYGDEPLELSMIEKSLFLLIKPQIDANERRRQNGCKGGAPRGNQNAQQKQPETTEVEQNQPTIVIEQPTLRNFFEKPTIAEIKAYCDERKNGVDANMFFDFYEAKGWQIGKEKMKDWKAAVRTWEKRKNTNNNGTEREKIARADEFTERL